jgi:hypothetical protein
VTFILTFGGWPARAATEAATATNAALRAHARHGSPLRREFGHVIIKPPAQKYQCPTDSHGCLVHGDCAKCPLWNQCTAKVMDEGACGDDSCCECKTRDEDTGCT